MHESKQKIRCKHRRAATADKRQGKSYDRHECQTHPKIFKRLYDDYCRRSAAYKFAYVISAIKTYVNSLSVMTISAITTSAPPTKPNFSHTVAKIKSVGDAVRSS